MAKKDTKNGYKLQIVAAELRDKRYRKYLYPSIIDGITYEDDTEKKLSESSWFRCLTPTQQIVVEKEMRLRMAGAFNQPVLVYRDADMDAAPAIPKPIFTRLAQSLPNDALRMLFFLIPYIHPNDGLLRNAKGELLTHKLLQDLVGAKWKWVDSALMELQEKRVIVCAKEKSERKTETDLFLDLVGLTGMTWKERSAFNERKRLAIYINPFVVFEGQYIDAFVVPYFQNSGWYVINPYATKILSWIEKNCK